ANGNAAVGGCASGAPGLDTIELQTDTTLTAGYDIYYAGATGLPLVTEDLIIEGNGFPIERDAVAPIFRILAVAEDVALTLNDTTITGGHSERAGGGIYAAEGVALTLNQSTVSGNRAGLDDDPVLDYAYPNEGDGGGIFAAGGVTTLSGSTLSGNTAVMEYCRDFSPYTVDCNL